MPLVSIPFSEVTFKRYFPVGKLLKLKLVSLALMLYCCNTSCPSKLNSATFSIITSVATVIKSCVGFG